MIKITDLHKEFHSGKTNEVKALQGLTLDVKKGEFLVIVGANGSGKSTLINIISGNIFPTSGRLLINDNNVSHLPEYARSKWIARVFQNPLKGTADELSVLENFRLASLRTQKKRLKIGISNDFKAIVKDKIASLGMGLEDKIFQPMGTLSGGQRQALTLLMAVMDKVEILLLDEPTAALDPRSAEIIMKTADNLIAQYKLTAILITHNMKEASSYGSRMIQLSEGRIVRDLDEEQKSKLSAVDLYEWFL